MGLLEEWDKSLEVLEHFIPRYFAGSREVFYSGEVSISLNLEASIRFLDRDLKHVGRAYLKKVPLMFILSISGHNLLFNGQMITKSVIF